MNYNEQHEPIFPIGMPEGPRGDYIPPPDPYRRVGKTDHSAANQAHAVQKQKSSAAASSSPSMPAKAPDAQAPGQTPEMKPMYTEGAHTDRIIAAVQSGQRTTTDIVAATGIPRGSAIKAISYLIGQKRLRELPAASDTPKGDRCVELVAIDVGASQPAADRKELPMHAEKALDEDSLAASAAQPESGTGKEDLSTESRQADHATFVSPAHENLATTIDANDGTLSAFKAIVADWNAIDMDVVILRAQASTVQKRLKNMAATLPVLREAMSAAEKARGSQAALTSIMESSMESLRSLDSIETISAGCGAKPGIEK